MYTDSAKEEAQCFGTDAKWPSGFGAKSTTKDTIAHHSDQLSYRLQIVLSKIEKCRNMATMLMYHFKIILYYHFKILQKYFLFIIKSLNQKTDRAKVCLIDACTRSNYMSHFSLILDLLKFFKSVIDLILSNSFIHQLDKN